MVGIAGGAGTVSFYVVTRAWPSAWGAFPVCMIYGWEAGWSRAVGGLGPIFFFWNFFTRMDEQQWLIVYIRCNSSEDTKPQLSSSIKISWMRRIISFVVLYSSIDLLLFDCIGIVLFVIFIYVSLTNLWDKVFYTRVSSSPFPGWITSMSIYFVVPLATVLALGMVWILEFLPVVNTIGATIPIDLIGASVVTIVLSVYKAHMFFWYPMGFVPSNVLSICSFCAKSYAAFIAPYSVRVPLTSTYFLNSTGLSPSMNYQMIMWVWVDPSNTSWDANFLKASV